MTSPVILPTRHASHLRLDLYTLACHQMLLRLHELRALTQRELRFDYEDCIYNVFNSGLERTLKRCAASTPEQVAVQFGKYLEGDIQIFRDGKSNGVAELFEALGESVTAEMAHWSHLTQLESFHQQGLQLARDFFADTTEEETRQRLPTVCSLEFEYGTPALAGTRSERLAETFGARYAPIAYYSSLDDSSPNCRQHVILVRLSTDQDFMRYLCFPFFFLHEYTAHVFSTGQSEQFNDGWMLYAASAFLKRRWVREPNSISLQREQVDVFQEQLLRHIGRIPRRGYNVARDLDEWLAPRNPDLFQRLTYRIAALQPTGSSVEFTATDIINAISEAFRKSPDRLLECLQSVTDLSTLLHTITDR
jgi:hypothetical protein